MHKYVNMVTLARHRHKIENQNDVARECGNICSRRCASWFAISLLCKCVCVCVCLWYMQSSWNVATMTSPMRNSINETFISVELKSVEGNQSSWSIYVHMIGMACNIYRLLTRWHSHNCCSFLRFTHYSENDMRLYGHFGVDWICRIPFRYEKPFHISYFVVFFFLSAASILFHFYRIRSLPTRRPFQLVFVLCALARVQCAHFPLNLPHSQFVRFMVLMCICTLCVCVFLGYCTLSQENASHSLNTILLP